MSCLSHHHHHQLHVHSYTITPHVTFQISHHNTHVPGGQPLSYLFHTTARPHHCLSVRITPVLLLPSFPFSPFPFIKEEKLRSTFTSLLNFLPFYMFYLLSIHVLTVMLYHLIPFLSPAFLSKFKVARTLFFK